MTLDKAISLAHTLRDFPNDKHGNPPTPKEALAIIEERLKRVDHVWITGEHAREVLEAEIIR